MQPKKSTQNDGGSIPGILTLEEISEKLHTLSDDLALTPPQAGVVLQSSLDQLANWRMTGEGPEFLKLGDGPKAPVRYRLGTMRAWLAGHTYANTAMANVSRFSSVGDFVTRGAIDDTLLVGIDDTGALTEFWESVRTEVDVVEVRAMRMDHMLDWLRAGANERRAERERRELGGDLAGGRPYFPETL